MAKKKKLDAVGIEVVCNQIGEAMPMREIAKKNNVSEAVLYDYLNCHPEHYARAREKKAETLVDQLLEIADNPTGDFQRDRLRLDTRKWLSSKMFPRFYGDKLATEHSGPNGDPIKIDVIEWGVKSNED